jgi:ABC-type maltose transport system permease subunit
LFGAGLQINFGIGNKMKKKTKKTFLIVGIILLVIALGLILYFSGLLKQTIFGPMYVDTYGLNCNTTACWGAKPTKNISIQDSWFLYYDAAENGWRAWIYNPYYKNFFYYDWDIESIKLKEYGKSSNNIWFNEMTIDFINQLKSSSKTQNNIEKYGELGLFKNSYRTHDNMLDWWSSLDYVKELENWKNDFFNNKICWIEFNSDLGMIKLYGKTKLFRIDLSCQLGKPLVEPEYIFLNNIYVPVNTTEGSQYMTIQHYTKEGSQEFPAQDFEVKVDFSQTEFPSQQVCCKSVVVYPGAVPSYSWMNSLDCNANGRMGVNLAIVDDSYCGNNPNPICTQGLIECRGIDKYTCNNNQWILSQTNSINCGYVPTPFFKKYKNTLIISSVIIIIAILIIIILNVKKKRRR